MQNCLVSAIAMMWATHPEYAFRPYPHVGTCRRKAAKQRAEALQAHDMDMYMQLVDKDRTKDSRLQHLLAETDACLRQLAGKLLGSRRAATTPAGEH